MSSIIKSETLGVIQTRIIDGVIDGLINDAEKKLNDFFLDE